MVSKRILAALLAASLFAVSVSCGHVRNHVGDHHDEPAPGGSRTAPTISLADVLARIDAYPTPNGVSAKRWAMLTAELKRLLVARSADAKTISLAPAGTQNAVSDLLAVSDAAGTQATLSWTEILPGDYDNDGDVYITDLIPVALYYGQRTDSGADDAHKLVNGDADPVINEGDLTAIATNYTAHLQGYQVWRGHWNGTSTDWEATARPNPNPANPDWSADRPTPPPASTRPTYGYTDDISGLTDKANVRYKVAAYGDGASGAESNEAVMPPPGSGHTVSGTVLESGAPLNGASLTLMPGHLQGTSQPDGKYEIKDVPDGAYTLTSSLTGYVFEPPSRTVVVAGADVTGQDFTGSVPTTHGVFGTVLQAGVGLPGVLMTLTPGGQTGTTAADGTYEIPGVPDGTFTVTASKSGYRFLPTSRQVTLSGANIGYVDFAATVVGTSSISGTVLESGSGLAGVVVTLTPDGLTATTQADGSYAITALSDGTCTLVPRKEGYSFSPPTRTVTIAGGDVTGADFTGTGGITGPPWPKFRGDARNTGQSPYVGAQTNTVKWAYQMGGGTRSSPAIGPDGTVYIGCDGDYYVYALNGADGFLKWKTELGVTDSSPAVGADGTIYIGGGVSGKAYALNAADGSIKWATGVLAANGVDGSPGIGPDGTVYIGCYQPMGGTYTFYALSPSDGSIKWRQALLQGVGACPAIGDDGTIYIGSFDGTLYALDPSDGAVRWTFKTAGSVASSAAVGADGTVYASSTDGYLYALSATDGALKWRAVTGRAGGYNPSSPAVAGDESVYISANRGYMDVRIYRVDSRSGSIYWAFAPAGEAGSSPAIGADGMIYVGAGYLYALTPDGLEKWHFYGHDRIDSSPAIGADGTVYVGGEDGYVYAFSP